MKSILAILFFFLSSQLSWSQLDLETEFTYDQLQSLLSQARSENDHQLLADVYYKLAQFEKDQFNNPNLAFEYFTRSRDYYKILEDKDQLFEIDRVIIQKSMESGLYSEAINSLESMLAKLDPIDDKSKVIRVHMDLATAHRGAGDTEKELQFQKLAIRLNEIESNPEIELELYLKQVDSYRDLNEMDSAMIYSRWVLKRAKELGKDQFACQAYFKQGNLYRARKKYKEALVSFKGAEEFCGKRPYSLDRLLLYEGLAKTYEEFNLYDQAYLYSSRYAALNDSILNQERSNSINNLTYKFGVKEKNKELRLLELENGYALERNLQQRRALWVLGIGLAGLAIFLYYTIRVYNQRIKANRLINVQREEINAQRISKLEDDIKINRMQSMLVGQESERERIAKDLHDSLGGLLSTIKLHFDAVQSKVTQVKGVTEYQKAHAMIDAAVDEVRSISQNLQPSSLENLGLIPAIKDLINRFDGKRYPEIDFQYYSFPRGLDKMTSLYIYRMVQELLHNSIKHAQAQEIMIQLTKDEGELVIHFEDDGIGFDPENTRKEGMGMENLKGRANFLKGSITIDSKSGEGSSFLIHIPYEGNRA